jgi:hypothetical protein
MFATLHVYIVKGRSSQQHPQETWDFSMTLHFCEGVTFAPCESALDGDDLGLVVWDRPAGVLKNEVWAKDQLLMCVLNLRKAFAEDTSGNLRMVS